MAMTALALSSPVSDPPDPAAAAFREAVAAADHRNGPGPLDEHFNAGMTRTVLELVEAMVIDSDNTAGTMGGSTNDAGLVTLPQGSGHLALVVFVKASTREVSVREAAIARIARAAWLAFAPGGAASGEAADRASLYAWSNP